MKKLILRASIILSWLALIFAALYWPKCKFLSYEKNTINVFTWGDILDPAVVEEFERKTHIKVNLSYYSSNEELMVKLKATGGEGYDLIVPSDYAVGSLIQDRLLKEIDKEKLSFWSAIHPPLLGHDFDPDNRYSIPFEWELFGFGIDQDYFDTRPYTPSWKMLFDPSVVDYKVTMVNDPIEAVDFASFYLYGPREHLSSEEIERVKQVLITQKPWVTAYAEFRGDYFLATRNCALVIASTSYIWRTKRLFDFVSFIVPEEGTFITIENLCIPKASSKEKLVYQFINYLYQRESVVSHFETFGFFPATLQSVEHLDIDAQALALLNSSEEQFRKYHFTRNILSQQEVRDLWVQVKASDY
ncbi:MAG: extracellular solute-binding protein [Verrucomicrobia bacterium]|nr:extracellular solute-binding protein [Verrucomicrobiota bacterium]